MQPDRPRRWELTVAGLATTCSITAVAALVHLLVYPFAFPAQAIAQNAVGVTSGSVDSFFIQLLGHWAERILVIGLSISFAVSGAVLVHLVPRKLAGRLWLWVALPLPVWAITVGIYSAPQPFLGRWAFAAASLPMFVLGGLMGYSTLAGTRGRGPRRRREVVPAPVPSPVNPDVTRRSLLQALGLGGLGVAVGSSPLGSLVGAPSDTGNVRLRATGVVRATVPPPAPGDQAFASVDGLTSELTPTEDFYVVDKDILNPVLDAFSWRLRVHGLVQRPLSMSFPELRSMQAFERYQTLECISNKVGGQLMSTALWTGIPVKDVLEKAGLEGGARTVVFRAAGGYSESHPLEKTLDPTTLIAIGMNRHQLPRIHGFPARVLTVGTYGMKNPKWLTDIEVIAGSYRGYWEVRGWSPDQDPKITTRIDVPEDGAKIGHSTVIAGVAFAGDQGISRVQVSTDDGRSWDDARVKTALSPYTWRLWMYEWRPSRPGTYRVLARAFDRSGRVQTSTTMPPFPSGAAGLDGITLES